MRSERFHSVLMMALVTFGGLLFVSGAWAAAHETVLHTFRNYPRPNATPDGADPFYGNLTFDTAGNLYGTTGNGGVFNAGTAFKLTRTESGWTEHVLYSFGHDNGSDGAYPAGGLTLDGAGNLYGTTSFGGDDDAGVVFELMPNADGSWTEKVLHSFNGTDGFRPYATLIFDAAGNLYGTTLFGGSYNLGTAFELSRTGGGNWSEQVLHSFGSGTDGAIPVAPLVFDTVGNIYGTTSEGGEHQCGTVGCGTVFKFSPIGGENWSEQVLHNFANDGVDGNKPFEAGLLLDSLGNLYGTTPSGGDHACSGEGCGAVFKLTPTIGGTWTEQVLYSFNDDGVDGNIPTGSLLFDAAGNLYSTTYFGGLYDNGTIFKLTPVGGGWTEQVLHNFNQSRYQPPFDGLYPGAGLIPDGAGNLYGTTFGGGVYGVGIVFEITP